LSKIFPNLLSFLPKQLSQKPQKPHFFSDLFKNANLLIPCTLTLITPFSNQLSPHTEGADGAPLANTAAILAQKLLDLKHL
jgi:hypothetical protein